MTFFLVRVWKRIKWKGWDFLATKCFSLLSVFYFPLYAALLSNTWHTETNKCSKTLKWKNSYWIHLKINIFVFSCDYQLICILGLILTYFFQCFQFAFARRCVNLLKFILFKIFLPITWHLKKIKATQSGTTLFSWSMIFCFHMKLIFINCFWKKNGQCFNWSTRKCSCRETLRRYLLITIRKNKSFNLRSFKERVTLTCFNFSLLDHSECAGLEEKPFR